jgi:GNAT superfamily N-acetyltransferase
VIIRPRRPADEPAAAAFLAEWHSTRVARLGELLRPLDFPALVAEDGGRLAGVLTYVVRGASCEVLTLHAARPWTGVGSALIAAVEKVAAEHGCRRLWLITTNDNVDALRFYQRRGFRLAALHAGAVDRSRAELKPEIPAVGDHGIPLRDELELDKPM